MTASDIIYIASTVAIVQGLCDALANRATFSSDEYKRRCSTLKRAKINRDKTTAQVHQNPIEVNSNSSAKAKDKQTKKLQRSEEDYQTAASNVSMKHVVPNILTALVFYVLYKILSLEYQGKIIALLPFTPMKFLQRFTLRGIQFDPEFLYEPTTQRVLYPQQGCGFLFMYLVCSMSVKVVMKQMVGTPPPSGADKGMFTMLDDPRGQRFMKAFGVDVDEYKEMRKQI